MPSVAVAPRFKKVVSLARSISAVPMSTKEFNGIPFIGNQRDHIRRAQDPRHIKQLFKPMIVHLVVHAAVLPNGDMWRLDANKRNEMWKNGSIPVPDEVLCLIYPVANKQEAEDLYHTFDSKQAVKTSTDEIFSGMRLGGFSPVSQLVRSCKFGEALTIAARKACRGYPKMDQVRDMLPVIRIFDTIMPTAKYFVTPVAAAALLSIMRDGEKAVPFWSAYETGEWEGEDSALEALEGYLNNDKTIWGKRADNILVAGRCLAIYNLWANNPDAAVDSAYPTGKCGSTVIKALKASLPK